MSARLRRLIAGMLALSLLLLPSSSGFAQARRASRCFPETGYCIAGRLREYWEQNGGLRVFGYPITPQQFEQVEGRPTQVQWFERNRLELHPENRRPYDVLLGRIGAERLGQPGHDQRAVRRDTDPDCRFFVETSRSACGAILAAWRASGLNLDGDPRIAERESIALFGLPLTDAQAEDTPGGRFTVQWFERARFELHPENAPPYHVQLGLLGREAAPVPSAAPPAVARTSVPTRLVIDSIGMDQQVVGVGLDGSGELVVPDHDVGWYTASAQPGQGENVVFWGHVLRFRQAPKTPAPFERLKDVRLGARVTVYDEQGQAHTYEVTRKVEVTPDQVSYILPQGHERVTMVSCYGEFVIVGREVVDMTRRLITIAEPVPEN